jgi:prepilin-type N-terminal cleavage/methylation domain-containing protein
MPVIDSIQIRGLRGQSRSGFTLVEMMVACAIIAFGIASIYLLNSQCLAVLKSAKDEASASQVLQQRIEQLRIANWQRVTSTTWIRDNLLNTSADGSNPLTNLAETVVVTPYNSSSTPVPNPNKFTRTAGVAAADGGNTSLLNETGVQVMWKITWNGVPNGKSHKRETMTVLGKGGIAK